MPQPLGSEGSKAVIGCPNEGASESRTVRGMTIRQTFVPKWTLTSCATSSASFVLASYMVRTIVEMSSFGLRLEATR